MVKPIIDVRSCLELFLVFLSSVLSLVVLPTNHWGQFYRPSPIDVIFEDGRYGLWGFCFVKAPRYIEDCESEELDFRMHKKALIAGVLSVLHLVVIGMLYLPLRLISTGIKTRAKASGCLTAFQSQRFMFIRFGCAFLGACFALAVIVVMSNATDGPKDYKLERDWCYYVQFAILFIDVLILASSVKEFIEEFDRPHDEPLRRKEVSAPTTTAPMPDDQSITNIDDFTVYSSTIATKESVYQPLKPQQGLQNSPKPTDVVHYVNEGVTVSQGGAPSVASEAVVGQRPSSNLIEMSPSPEMPFFDESASPDGRTSFVSPGPPSEEGSESQFALSPEPAPAPVSPGIPPPPPPMPPGAQGVASHDYQVPASQPIPAKPPSQDGTPKGPFGFVLPPLKFQPKNYDEDSDFGYKSPRGEDNPAFEENEGAPSQTTSPPPQPPATSTPAPVGGPPPPPPPPPPPGWQPPK